MAIAVDESNRFFVDSCHCCGNWCKVTSTTRKSLWRTTSDRFNRWISDQYAPTSTFTIRSASLVFHHKFRNAL